MEVLVNPADRLYEIIVKAKEKSKGTSSIEEMWADTFGVEKENKSKIFSELVSVVFLIENIKKELLLIKSRQKESLIENLAGLQKLIMNTNLESSSSIFNNSLKDIYLNSIQGCAVALDASHKYIDIKEEEIKQIQEEVVELIGEINNSEIEKIFKDFLVKKLSELNLTISEYRILGLEGIKSKVDEVTGSMFHNYDMRNSVEVSTDSNIKKLFDKTIGILITINNLITLGKNVAPLIEKFGKLFLKWKVKIYRFKLILFDKKVLNMIITFYA